MKLSHVLILSLAVVFLIIAIHQIMTVGFGDAYWAVMLSLLLFFLLNYVRRK